MSEPFVPSPALLVLEQRGPFRLTVDTTHRAFYAIWQDGRVIAHPGKASAQQAFDAIVKNKD